LLPIEANVCAALTLASRIGAAPDVADVGVVVAVDCGVAVAVAATEVAAEVVVAGVVVAATVVAGVVVATVVGGNTVHVYAVVGLLVSTAAPVST
jgi:hypothetical protein